MVQPFMHWRGGSLYPFPQLSCVIDPVQSHRQLHDVILHDDRVGIDHLLNWLRCLRLTFGNPGFRAAVDKLESCLMDRDITALCDVPRWMLSATCRMSMFWVYVLDL